MRPERSRVFYSDGNQAFPRLKPGERIPAEWQTKPADLEATAVDGMTQDTDTGNFGSLNYEAYNVTAPRFGRDNEKIERIGDLFIVEVTGIKPDQQLPALVYAIESLCGHTGLKVIVY